MRKIELRREIKGQSLGQRYFALFSIIAYEYIRKMLTKTWSKRQALADHSGPTKGHSIGQIMLTYSLKH